MPLTPVGAAAILTPALVSCGQLGIAVPQLALGVGTGMSVFAKASVIVSINGGTLGPGVTTLPFLVPQPLLLASLLGSFAGSGILGVMAPLLATGLANGMSVAFLQGLVTMVQIVGVGAGVAKVIPAGAVPAFIGGFAAAGLTGKSAVQLATAIGIAMNITFAAYVFPVPIVGAPSIVPVAGVPSVIGTIV